MSKALDFLLARRPAAMGAYFDFLRDNGSRLDPKTRALISVITKVAVETEKGLVQYTRKAYAAGCSPDEVLDALMMAFPALGLSRILWAVEVLQAHAVDGFTVGPTPAAAAPSPADADVIDIGPEDALPRGRAVKYSTGGRPLLLYRDDEGVRAYKAYCPHQGMELMDSGIEGKRVTCRQHGWQFILPEGTCTMVPRCRLAALAVEVTDGRVRVRWTG